MSETNDLYLTKEEIVDLIKKKFGTVVEYARVGDTTSQNIYGKLRKITGAFANELESNGIIVRKSQIGQNTYTENKADKELVKILKDMVNTQKETIMFQREELRQWRKRCEDCEQRLKNG